jgi:cystathionine beta-lyase
MTRVDLPSLRLVVDHRNPGRDGGPTLRVYGGPDRGRELLRFDCFERGGHWHLDPVGRDEITSFTPEQDPLEWTIAEVRRDLASYVERAGGALAGSLDPARLSAALDEVELALRNPPVDFDAVRPAHRRPSFGEKWNQYPEDVLPVWVADMDFPLAGPIQRALRRAIDRSDLGYPIHPAPTDVPEITVERMDRRYGWRPQAANVEILTDVVQGMYAAVWTLTGPGDGLVVQTPIYPPFLGCARNTERRLVENPLALEAEGFRVDLEGLRRVVDAGTRAILLCNPHNPSGRAFRRDELEGIAEAVLAHDLLVVSDEIHQDLVFGGHEHIPFASLSPEIEARTITLTAASKAFNTAGLRCAVAIFGSAELRRGFRALPRHIRGGIGVPGIESLRAAWRYGQPWLDALLPYLEANRDFVVDFVRRELPGVRLHRPEATYLAWLDCRDLGLEPSPYHVFLEKGRVALSAGQAFGSPGRGFVRLNFGTSRAILTDALERMAKALR